MANADENRVQQILHNLVGNAIKFTEEGTICIEAEKQDGWLSITVADTGIGIPKEKQETVFHSFEQGDGSVAREYGGTGLGLAICKGLAEQMHGRLSVESTVGVGTTVTGVFPMATSNVGLAAVH